MPDTPSTLSTVDFRLLCEVIAGVARASGLPPQDAEDFGQQRIGRPPPRGHHI